MTHWQYHNMGRRIHSDDIWNNRPRKKKNQPKEFGVLLPFLLWSLQPKKKKSFLHNLLQKKFTLQIGCDENSKIGPSKIIITQQKCNTFPCQFSQSYLIGAWEMWWMNQWSLRCSWYEAMQFCNNNCKPQTCTLPIKNAFVGEFTKVCVCVLEML